MVKKDENTNDDHGQQSIEKTRATQSVAFSPRQII
jgi:hypothetical protein